MRRGRNIEGLKYQESLRAEWGAFVTDAVLDTNISHPSKFAQSSLMSVLMLGNPGKTLA
jgi:hypothetical protein